MIAFRGLSSVHKKCVGLVPKKKRGRFRRTPSLCLIITASCLELAACDRAPSGGSFEAQRSALTRVESPQVGELPPKPGNAKYRIHLRHGILEGSAPASHRPRPVTGIDAAPDAEQKRQAYFIAFDGPITDAMQAEVEGAGAHIVEYAPDFALLVLMKPSVAEAVSVLSHVLEVLAFLPDYKIDPDLALALSTHPSSTNEFPLSIALMEEDPGLLGHFARLGVRLVSQSGRRVLARAPLSAVSELAKLDVVKFIEERKEAQIHNDVAAGLVGMETVASLGYQGAGQLVAVSDTGLDTGKAGLTAGTLLADFAGRVVDIVDVTGLNADGVDQNGHGTHVAGSVLGDGQLSNGKLKGIAPKANLFVQQIFGPSGRSSNLAYGTIMSNVYDRGAKIHSNSWTEALYGKYSVGSAEIDDFIWSHQDAAILFAAGNAGRTGGTSVGSPATAKNCITVGATVNYRPNLTATNNPGERADFSSYGTVDGRVKPDVVAPGEQVASTRSSQVGLYRPYPGNDQYEYKDGTSMSTPIVAGSVAVLREFLHKQWARSNPSAALLKAMLIGGALVDGASADKGWGKIGLDHSMLSAKIVDDASTLTTYGTKTYVSSCPVTNPALPLKVVLAWSDYPGSENYAKALVNDLDLVVTAPSGRVFLGNGAADRLNNVETVVVNAPEAGTYRFEVRGYQVARGPQPYALVCSSDFLGVPKNLRADATVSSNSLAWDPVPGATEYEIEADGRSVTTTSNTYVDSGLSGNSVHFYRVRARTSGSAGSWGNTIVQWTALPSPQVLVENRDGYALMTWSPVAEASRYAVYMDGHLLAPLVSPSFEFKTIEPLMSHSFVVRALSDFNFGASAPLGLTQPAPGIAYERQLASAREGLAVALAADGTAFAFGGRDANALVLDSVVAIESGAAKQSMPKAVHRAAAATIGDRIYVAGGNDGVQDLGVLQVYDPATDTWQQRQPMPQRRSGHAAFASNGKLIVIGGADGTSSLKSVQAYDPSTDQWSELRPMITPRKHFASVMAGGQIVCLGGRNQDTILDVVEAYDPVANTWTARKPLLAPNADFTLAEANGRFISIGGTQGTAIGEYDPMGGNWSVQQSWPSAVTAHGAYGKDGKVHVVGGLLGRSPTADIIRYDLALAPWSKHANLNTPRYHWPVLGEINGKLITCGGLGGFGTGLGILKGCESYDPAQDRWTDVASLDHPVHFAATAAAGGRLYVMGGSEEYNDSEATGATADFREYDPAADRWTILPDLPLKVTRASAAALGNAIYLTGGEKAGGESGLTLASVYKYDLSSRQWTPLANMNHARDGHITAALDGKLYVVGGEPKSTTTSIEQYDPSTNQWTITGTVEGTGFTGVGVANNRVYVMQMASSDLVEIAPATGQWKKLALNTNRASTTLITVGDKLYAVGGGSWMPTYLTASPALYSTTEILPLLSAGTALLNPTGGKTMVPVRVSRVPVGGWSQVDLVVRFDPAKVTVSNVTAGAVLPAGNFSSAVDPVNGIAVLSWFGHAGNLLTDEGTLGNLEVDIVDTMARGTTALAIDSAGTKLFSSPGVRDMQYRTQDGAVDIFLRGDVNKDGQVGITDALLVGRYTAGLVPVLPDMNAADANCDGQVTIADGQLIARHASGLPPVGGCSMP